MDLVAKEGDIKSYAKLIGRATDDVQKAGTYLRANSQVEDSIGDLWQLVFGSHEDQLARAEKALKAFESILDKSDLELVATADFYRTTDHGTAAQLDAIYRSYADEVAYGPGVYESGHKNFSDAKEPTSHLVAPGGPDGYIQGHVAELKFAPGHKTLGTIMDLGSPSALAAEGIKAVLGIDIFGIATKWITGDWDSYANCADVWDNLGKLSTDVGTNITSGFGDLYPESWAGNAADAAHVYFSNIDDDLVATREAFESMRDNYKVTAVSVFSFAEIVKGILADICDAAIAFAITAAATAAAASTGVGVFGALVGGAVALERANHIVQRYGALVAKFDGIMIALNAIWGATTAGAAKIDYPIKDFPSLGKTGYNHPTANRS